MGKPHKPFSKMLKRELIELAKDAGHSKLSRLTKDEIIALLEQGGGRRPADQSGASARSASAPGSKTGSRPLAAPRTAAGPSAEAGSRNARAKPKASPRPVSRETREARSKAARRRAEGERPARPRRVVDEGGRTTGPRADAGAPAASARRPSAETLRGVDERQGEPLADPGENRLVLMPRDPEWLYAYWTLEPEYRTAAREAGGEVMALRLYDVSDADLGAGTVVAEHICDEWAQNWYIPVPVPGRRYAAEVGYRGGVHWFPLARSNAIWVPDDRVSVAAGVTMATIDFAGALPVGSRQGDPSSAGDTGWPAVAGADAGAAVTIPGSAVPGSVPIAYRVEQVPGSQQHVAGSLQVPGSLGVPGSQQHVAGSPQVPGSGQPQLAGRGVGQPDVPGAPGSLGHLPQPVFPPPYRPGTPAAPPYDVAPSPEGGHPLPAGDVADHGDRAAPAGPPPPMLMRTRITRTASEIVIDGHAVPGATIRVGGRAIPLGPNGAFNVRLALQQHEGHVAVEAERDGERQVEDVALGAGQPDPRE